MTSYFPVFYDGVQLIRELKRSLRRNDIADLEDERQAVILDTVVSSYDNQDVAIRNLLADALEGIIERGGLEWLVHNKLLDASEMGAHEDIEALVDKMDFESVNDLFESVLDYEQEALNELLEREADLEPGSFSFIWEDGALWLVYLLDDTGEENSGDEDDPGEEND